NEPPERAFGAGVVAHLALRLGEAVERALVVGVRLQRPLEFAPRLPPPLFLGVDPAEIAPGFAIVRAKLDRALEAARGLFERAGFLISHAQIVVRFGNLGLELDDLRVI